MQFFTVKVNFEKMNLLARILACFFLGSFYVISLYLWSKQNRFLRNDPAVIKRRFFSVFISSVFSLVFVYCLCDTNFDSYLNEKDYANLTRSYKLNEWIGFKFDFGLIKSIFISLFLTKILFAGPLFQILIKNYLITLRLKIDEYVDSNSLEKVKHITDSKSKKNYLRMNMKFDELINFRNFIRFLYNDFKFIPNIKQFQEYLCDIYFWRNYIISPFSEEFVFRSCVITLLFPQLAFGKTIILTPLFFGLAHLHHIIEGYFNKEYPFNLLVQQHLFQFCYTYIFGVYSAYLFLRTGNFFASFVSHAFCNMMGFPNVAEVANDFSGFTRICIIAFYFIGLFTFVFLLPTLTNPVFFENTVYI